MSESPLDDGLVIPEIGHWGLRKYHFLSRYLDQFTKSMREKWPSIHYVDLFAGAGLARIRTTGDIVRTSGLIAATLTYPFTRLHLCEANEQNCLALKTRLSRVAPSIAADIHHGDANTLADRVARALPAGSLSVVFADPFGLHLDFETVKCFAQRKCDLIVLLADNMDALRNWATYYRDNPNSSLDKFMGEPGWRDALSASRPEQQAVALRSRYEKRLESLGYSHFGHARFQNSKGADIYSLVYASRHPLGLKFWKNTVAVDEGGQRSFDFGP